MKDLDGNPCLSQEAISERMHNHFAIQFKSPDNWEPPRWVYGEFPNNHLRHIDALGLKPAISNMKSGKSCSRFDLVVAEMVKPLLEVSEQDNSSKIEPVREVLREALLNDLLGRKTGQAQARHRLKESDAPLCLLPPAERQRTRQDWRRSGTNSGTFKIDVEVCLLPKGTVVSCPKELRPISLAPVLRKLLGDLALAKTQGLLKETGARQFACKSGCQNDDLTLLIRMLGQRSMEWRVPFLLGVTDMPKCFDEVGHSFLLEAILHMGVDRAIAAWFVREARSSVLHLRLGGVDVPLVCVARGIPQGSRYGPSLCAAVLHCCIEPAWKSCRRDRLGYRQGDQYIPFVLFCDNIFILAHDANDVLEILSRLQFALVMGGWRLPDDRIAYQINKYVGDVRGTQLKEYKEEPRGTSFKALGSMINAAGTCHADIAVKRRGCSSAIEKQRSLWQCPRVSRQKKLSLMHEVATSNYSCCVGAWIVNQRELSSLKAAFTKAAKSVLRVPRKQGDTDEAYHRTCNRILRDTIIEGWAAVVDVYALRRMHDYTGHLVRAIRWDPEHLVGAVILRGDSEWKCNMTDTIGLQGHP
ncbi:unnamed protein product, partial [Prorocentrum cordatum]